MGYDLEVDAIRIAREKDLLTAPYVFDVESAVAMTKAGADVLVPHMGLTTKGTIGASTAKTLDESVTLVQEMHDAAVAIRPDVIVLCHGGPIAEPEDARYVLERTQRRQGLLRRLEHGAAADRGRDDREHAAFQGPHLQPLGARDEHIRQAGRDRGRPPRLGRDRLARAPGEHRLQDVRRDGRRRSSPASGTTSTSTPTRTR